MLTSAGVREMGYEIDDDRGTITSPGKFEGEPWFTVAIWDACLDGCEGEQEDSGYWVRVTEETAEFFEMDREVYPIGSYLYVWEDDYGFVRTAKHAHKIETVTGVGYAHWASYLINGDRSGLDYYSTPSDPGAGDREVAAADAFAEWLGGYITGVSDETFFARPDTGGLPGDCVTYTAIVRAKGGE